MIYKCKMCGGDVTINESQNLGTCQFCGSTMTFPKITSEKRAEAFNRGNQLRRIGEFDHALAVYENIVSEDPTDAEAHWCCALCRYGIEYVEDPATFEYIPTCHRASFDSFLDDIDYLAACENSEGIIRKQYQKDAVRIDEVQKGILKTSQNEDPYDVFICYKETDAAGRRTIDSTLAQDIYSILSDKGYKTFFARITLEDKVGSEYEPYIFAALNSAKAMIVVGTSRENLESVWVKNEWSRFLSIIKKDREKVLIPCYKNMKPEDMPEGLSALQAYDMTAIGFMQDLVHGLEKILKKRSNQVNAKGESVDLLLKKLELYKDNSDYKQVMSVAKMILDTQPDNVQAYVSLVLATYKIESITELKKVKRNYAKTKDYQMLYKLADEKMKATLDQQEMAWKVVNKRRTIKRLIAGAIATLVLILGGWYGVNMVRHEMYVKAYNQAIAYAKEGKNADAKAALVFPKLVNEKHPELYQYFDACDYIDVNEYQSAKDKLESLPEHYLRKDELIEQCEREILNNELQKMIIGGEYEQALSQIKQRIADGEIIEESLISTLADKHLTALADSKEYVTAYKTIREYKELGLSCDAKDSEIVSKICKDIPSWYANKKYSDIRNIKNIVASDSRYSLDSLSEVYVSLSRLHMTANSTYVDKSDVNVVRKNLEVGDSKTLLLKSQALAEEFLCGTWKSGNAYFTMRSNGSISYSFPVIQCNHNYYEIQNGTLYLFTKSIALDGEKWLDIEINSDNSVSFYNYRNGQTITLTRQ